MLKGNIVCGHGVWTSPLRLKLRSEPKPTPGTQPFRKSDDLILERLTILRQW